MKLFQPGDIVQVPGGTLMTVSAMVGGRVRCTWFQRGIMHEDMFEPNNLSLRGLPAASDENASEPFRG